MTGEPALVDLDEESDSEEQDFDSWVPDPVDADPGKIARGLTSYCSYCTNQYFSKDFQK